MNSVGFMQGRLVDQIDGKIQAFPWKQWELEFPRGAALGLGAMEWTLDHTRLAENPFVTADGQEQIRALMAQYDVAVPSVTCDCCMQAPFWKCAGARRGELLTELDLVLRSAAELRVRFVVIPLVDNGGVENDEQRELLTLHLMARAPFLRHNDLQIIFETDYDPITYAWFMEQLPEDAFNINYDMGNSASLGFDPLEEFAAYGERIVNVHVKDRLRGGGTVALGAGAVDFDRVFAGLARQRYSGNFILQTARAADGAHESTLAEYLRMVTTLWRRYYEP